MRLYTKETGVPYRDFTGDFLRHVVENLALGTFNWAWKTSLPFGRDWLEAKSEEIAEMKRKSITDEQWIYGPEVWAAMPWGRDAGVWEFGGQTNGARWVQMPASQRMELPVEKPSWDQVWTVIRPLIIDRWQNVLLFDGQTDIKVRRNRAAREAITLPGLPELHTGAGLEHMPALIHAVSAGDLAGAHFAPAVMRHRNGPGTAALWTRDEAHELLGRLTDQTNRAESAYNIVQQRYLEISQPLLDENGMLGEDATKEQILIAKEAAIQKAHAFIQPDSIDSEFEKALTSLSELPDDLPTLRKVLSGRLEETAMAHVKYMRGVVTQQGIDLPDACDEVADASKKAARLTFFHQQEISESETVEAAKTAFEKGKTAIEAIKPLNTPTFHLRELTAEQPSPARFTRKKLLLTVRNPEMEVGAITLHGQVVSGNANLNVTSKTVNEIECDMEIGTAEATMDVVARNLCGPSVLRVTLTPPSED